jgi:hypothetical protein
VASYHSPPPFELVGGKDIALFQNTTNPPLTPLNYRYGKQYGVEFTANYTVLQRIFESRCAKCQG